MLHSYIDVNIKLYILPIHSYSCSYLNIKPIENKRKKGKITSQGLLIFLSEIFKNGFPIIYSRSKF